MTSYHGIVSSLRPNVEYHQNRYARELADVVAAGCRWLDLGAGTSLHWGWGGTPQSELAQRATLLVGCDPATVHLRSNRYLTSRVSGIGERLPFRSRSFDLVTANMVVEHLPNPVVAFTEVSRVLDAKGSFIFVTPNVEHPIVRLLSGVPQSVRSMLARLVEGRSSEHIFPTFYRANTVSEIHRLATDAGFRLRRAESFWSHPVIRRPVLAARFEARWIRRQVGHTGNRRGSNLIVRLDKRSAGEEC